MNDQRISLRIPDRRRSVRLRGRDYALPGVYFVTICTRNGDPLLGDVVHRRVWLSAVGQHARACWLDIPRHLSWVLLDAFVIMPDHVHGIVWIRDDGATTSTDNAVRGVTVGARHVVPLQPNVVPLQPNVVPRQQPAHPVHTTAVPSFGYSQPRSLPRIIGSFKAAVSRRSAQASGIRRSIWQRNYYEHIIRSDRALDRIRRYIQTNPERWDR